MTCFGLSTISPIIVSSECQFGTAKLMYEYNMFIFHDYTSPKIEKTREVLRKLMESDGSAIVFTSNNDDSILGYIKYHRNIRQGAVRCLTRISRDYQIRIVENVIYFINPSVYSRISDRLLIMNSMSSMITNPYLYSNSNTILMISSSKRSLLDMNGRFIITEDTYYTKDSAKRVCAIINKGCSQDLNELSGFTDIMKARLMMERKNLAVNSNSVIVSWMIMSTLYLAVSLGFDIKELFILFQAQVAQLMLTGLSFLDERIKIAKRNTKGIIYELVSFLVLNILCSVFGAPISVYYLVWSVLAGIVTYTLSQNELWIIIVSVIIISAVFILLTI